MSDQPNTEILTLTVTDLARGGAGVSRDASGRVIFIPFTAPGDQVRVRVVEQEKRYAQAELLEVLEPSPVRQKPVCPYFSRCGGCQWQHLPYELQWKTKVGGVSHALSRVGIDWKGAVEERPAEQIWNYRNRVQLRGPASDSPFGFYAPKSHVIVGVAPDVGCAIARSEINAKLSSVGEEAKRFRKPYKVEVEVLPSGDVTSTWNSGHSASGFRQVHDDQNGKLRDWVEGVLSSGRVLYDLYGGSGNLSWSLSERMKRIHCVDLGTPFSKPDQPKNFEFHRSGVLPWLLKQPSLQIAVESSAILDPPREGLESDFSEIEKSITRLGVSELVHVGCDVDSWAKDVYRFVRRGWTLRKVMALDFFPQTPHVESVAFLIRL